MADRESVRNWRKRGRWCEIGFVVSLLVPAFHALTGWLPLGVVLFFALLVPLFFVAGLVFRLKHWRAFREFEIANGNSKQAADEKWNGLYPTRSLEG